VLIEQTGTSPRRRRSVELAVVADTRFRFAAAVERAQYGESTPLLDRIDLYGTLERWNAPATTCRSFSVNWTRCCPRPSTTGSAKC
jgi:hypothetical protein